jgi:hypothetical protein
MVPEGLYTVTLHSVGSPSLADELLVLSCRYIKSDLLFDLLGIMPWDTIYKVRSSNDPI